MNEHKFAAIGDIGKFALIQRLLGNNKTSQVLANDCIISQDVQGVIVTSHLMAEGVHFNLVYTPLIHLGYKAIVCCLIKLYARYSIAKEVSVSFAVSNKLYTEHLEALFEGMKLACEKYNAKLNLAEITPSVTGLIITVTALGGLAMHGMDLQYHAHTNDLICVTGNLGAAYMGLQVLERERRIFESANIAQPELDKYKYIIERQLKPEINTEVIKMLGGLGCQPSSMMFISDGLASGLWQICTQSQRGCKIFAEKIPIDYQTHEAAQEMRLEPLTCALNGGEDYEFLFTLPLSDYDKIADYLPIRVIGHIISNPDEKILIFESGAEIPLKAQGWN